MSIPVRRLADVPRQRLVLPRAVRGMEAAR